MRHKPDDCRPDARVRLQASSDTDGLAFVSRVDRVRAKQSSQAVAGWQRENQEAIAAYNLMVDMHGSWNEGFRAW